MTYDARQAAAAAAAAGLIAVRHPPTTSRLAALAGPGPIPACRRPGTGRGRHDEIGKAVIRARHDPANRPSRRRAVDVTKSTRSADDRSPGRRIVQTLGRGADLGDPRPVRGRPGRILSIDAPGGFFGRTKPSHGRVAATCGSRSWTLMRPDVELTPSRMLAACGGWRAARGAEVWRAGLPAARAGNDRRGGAGERCRPGAGGEPGDRAAGCGPRAGDRTPGAAGREPDRARGAGQASRTQGAGRYWSPGYRIVQDPGRWADLGHPETSAGEWRGPRRRLGSETGSLSPREHPASGRGAPGDRRLRHPRFGQRFHRARRARGPGRSQRCRQDDAAPDRHAAATTPTAARSTSANGIRVGMLGQESNRDEAFAGSPDRPSGGALGRRGGRAPGAPARGAGVGRRRCGRDPGVRPPAGAVRPSRWLSHRPAGGGDAVGAGRAEGGLGAVTAGRCRAASRRASRWRGCWSTTRTCCCSTSPPTTSTSRRSSGWRRTSPGARVRCWSRPTTGRSWTRS